MIAGSRRNWPGIRDLIEAAGQYRLILFISYSDIRSRYKRTVLGPFWLTLSTTIGAVGLGLVWSELFKIPKATFVPMLTAGLILWQLISSVITDSSTLFSRQSPIIRNLSLPLAIHPAQLLLRHIFNLLHTAPIFFLVALFFGAPLDAATWLAIPGFALVAMNLFWMSLLIAIIGARFRDFEFIINAAVPILMFISPVFYRPNYLPFSETVIWLNPLSHLIEIVRSPLLGSPPPDFVVVVNLAMLLGGGLVTLWVFNRTRNRIAFWM